MQAPTDPRGTGWHLALLWLAVPFLLSAQEPARAQASLQTIKSFDQGGSLPLAGVIEASDGALYGTTEFGGQFDSGTVYRVNRDGSGFALLHEFNCSDSTNGCRPQADLIEGSDGALYGTTSDGGSNFLGTVFRIGKDGTGFALVHSFTRGQSQSADPGGVVEGSDGALYGTTRDGGVSEDGEVFRVNKDGSGYTVLHSFRREFGTDGASPPTSGARAGVVEGNDGRLYGTTEFGGAFDDGIVFAINKDGTGYVILHDFECNPSLSIGCRTNSGLIEASDGALYGTMRSGAGVPGFTSTLFRINTDGTGFAVVHGLAFVPGTSISVMSAGITEASDGALYGTTTAGGASDEGTVFRVNKDGSGFAVVHSFECGEASTDVCRPSVGVIEGSDGALYAALTANAPVSGDNGAVLRLGKDGTGVGLVHAFRCGLDGCAPEAPLLEASDGALYGTTSGGGTAGAGIVFRIGQDGSGFAVLHDFACSDTAGCLPGSGGLIEGSDGALYGTTSRGGLFNQGTAFAINKDGTGFRLLRSFECLLSCEPGGLLEASDGALYGTMAGGGAGSDGSVFRIGKDGTGFTELYSLVSAADGDVPQGGLIEGSDGGLYGVTSFGGPLNAGTAFRIDRDGSGFTVLHSFQRVATNAGSPAGGLIEGSNGVIYGAAASGGANLEGAIYALNRDGSGFSLLHSFDCPGFCGVVDVIEGSDGALYGTTTFSPAGRGFVFRLRKDGTAFTVLHPFVFPCTGDNGCNPRAGLIEGSDGAFYGTTGEGGGGAGTLFRLTLDPVSASPTLVVASPEPGAVVPEGSVPVEGTASDDVSVDSVTVNGIEAVLTSTGNPQDANEVSFLVPVALAAGDHTIEVIATDGEGNTETVLVDLHVMEAEPLRCDVNRDDSVDRADIALIFAARGQTATGPDDPRDVNGDGLITINDGRICVLECTNPACAPNAAD